MTVKVFELGAQNVHKKSILESFRLRAKNVYETPFLYYLCVKFLFLSLADLCTST